MAEVIVNLQSENQDSKRLAKYECSKLNLLQDVTIGQIKSEIEIIQNQMNEKIEEYETLVSKMEVLIRVLSGNHRILERKSSEITI